MKKKKRNIKVICEFDTLSKKTFQEIMEEALIQELDNNEFLQDFGSRKDDADKTIQIQRNPF